MAERARTIEELRLDIAIGSEMVREHRERLAKLVAKAAAPALIEGTRRALQICEHLHAQDRAELLRLGKH